MGKLSRGYLGGFQGQLGTAYGCFWRLMDLIKAMPRKVKRAPTEAQLPARLKMSLMVAFLSGLRNIIKVGFKYGKPSNQSAMNAAVSYNLNKAITGAAPNYTIDFPNLLFSKGALPLPMGLDVTPDAGAKVKFKWLDAIPGGSSGTSTDKATFVVYNETTGTFVTLNGVIERSALEYSLQLPPPFVGDTIHCYISFVSADGKEVTNSTHITEFVVV